MREEVRALIASRNPFEHWSAEPLPDGFATKAKLMYELILQLPNDSSADVIKRVILNIFDDSTNKGEPSVLADGRVVVGEYPTSSRDLIAELGSRLVALDRALRTIEDEVDLPKVETAGESSDAFELVEVVSWEQSGLRQVKRTGAVMSQLRDITHPDPRFEPEIQKLRDEVALTLEWAKTINQV